MDILIFLVQTALLPFAGVALYRLWKRVASTGTWIRRLVTAGLLARTGLGLLLFWVSYLPIRLPAGMEDDNGFWFYAWDGRMYFRAAVDAALRGPAGILAYPKDAAAAFFVKIMAAFVYVLGGVAPVALLMNLFAFLGTCALLVMLFPRDSRVTTAAVGALSLSPSLILWSAQPLKDIVFLFLIAAFVVMAMVWQDLWRKGGAVASRAIVTGLGLVVLLYGIAGVRWYFALLLLIASIPFFLMTSVRTRAWTPALASLAAGVVIFGGLVAAFFAGGGPYIPEEIQSVVKRDTAVTAMATLPALAAERIVGIRSGFKNTAANTDIVAGSREPEPVKVAQSAPPPASREAASSPTTPGAEPTEAADPPQPPRVADSTVPQISVTEVASIMSKPFGDDEGAKKTPAQAETPAKTPDDAPVVPKQGTPVVAHAPTAPTSMQGPPTHATSTQPAATQGAPAQAVPVQPIVTATQVPAPTPVAPAPQPVVTQSAEPVQTVTAAPAVVKNATPKKSAPARRTSKKVQPVAPPVTTTTVAAAPVPVTVPAPATAAAPAAPVPQPDEGGLHEAQFRTAASKDKTVSSHVSQLLVGVTAMILPRFVAEKLGLFHVAGGGGMWLFVEMDTLYFDAVVLFAAFALFRALRGGGWRSPALALVLATTFAILGMLSYTITNFGTLFRHRGMVFIGLVMIPLIVAAERARNGAAAAAPDAVPEGGS